MASTYDWTRFSVRINVNAPTQKIYDAWSTRAGIESWFLRLSEVKSKEDVPRADDEQIIEGDSYHWLWHGHPDDVAEKGTFTSANGKDELGFTFGKAGNCHVTIFHEAGETVVDLTQDAIPADEQGKHVWHLGCKAGWTFYFANLKSICEGGLDLRNKNVQLQQVINS